MTWEQILSTIRTAVFGKDVREGIAQGMETVKTFRDEAAASAAEAAAALPLSTTLDQSGKAADAKATGDAIAKAIITGVALGPTNYERYFTDANNAPRNHSYNILGTITEGMIPNLPVYGTNGMLLTISGKSDGTNVLLQLYTTSSTTFFRSCIYSQQTWTEWKEMASKQNVNDVVFGAGIIHNLNYTSFFTDANDAPRNHSYTILGTVTQSMVTNLPVYGSNGLIITFDGNGLGTNVLLQLYTTSSTTFFRSCNYSQQTWTDWNEMASIQDVDDLVFGAGEISPSNYTSFFTDANDAPRNHSYTILGTVTQSMVTNLPVYGTNGLIITFDGNGRGTNVLLQFYATSKTVFFRSCIYSQQTWTNWKEIASPIPVYHVGPSREYTSFTQCIWDLKDDSSEKIIYVDGGVYDIVQEYEDAEIPVIPDDGDYNSGYTPYNAWIPENTHVIGLGNVTFRYAPTSTDVSVATSKTVSPLNAHKSCIIENVTVEVKNGRYALHSDGQGYAAYSDSVIQFRNVRFVREINDAGLGWNAVVGIGLDKRQLLKFDKCIFETRMPNANFYAHNRGNVGGAALTEADSSGIILSHCVFVGAEDTSNLLWLQYRSTTNLLRIPIKIIDCYIGGTIHLQQQASGVQNCFDLTILNSGNPTVVIDDANNPYPVKIFSTEDREQIITELDGLIVKDNITPIKIGLYGASIVAGAGATDYSTNKSDEYVDMSLIGYPSKSFFKYGGDLSWARQFEEYMESTYPNVTVENWAVSGSTSSSYYDYLSKSLANGNVPLNTDVDIAIIMMGNNGRSSNMDTNIAGFEEIINLFKRNGAKVFFLTPTAAFNVSETFVLNTYQIMQCTKIAAHNAGVASVDGFHWIEDYCDLAGVSLAYDAQADKNFLKSDNLHPSDTGHEIIFKAVRSLLKV